MAACISRSSGAAGRCLVATRTIEAGAVVLEDKPYVAVLHDEHVPKICDYCYKRSDDLSRCSKSKFARYCSRQHQSLAWKAGFKQEAEALVNLSPKIPPPTIRLAARAIWKRLR